MKINVTALACCTIAVPVLATSASHIDASTASWWSAAQSGRANILIFGDSVTLFGGHGWDAGFHIAAQETVGLAATGVIPQPNAGAGEGYYFSTQLGMVSGPAIPEHTVLLGTGSHTPSGGGRVHFGISSTSIANRSDAAELNLWTAGSSNMNITPSRRLGASPWTILQTLPEVTVNQSMGQVTQTTISYPALTNPSSGPTEFLLSGIDAGTTVGYAQLVRPGATGLSVTSRGYGGRSARDFYTDRWIDNLNDHGRETYLDAVGGEVGQKLNVVIMQGFNDRNETDPSLTQNITDADSPEAFLDNIETLIGSVRSTWVTLGRDLEDLSFTVFGMYDIAGNVDELRDYAAILQNYAIDEAGVSFIDLFQLAPSFEDATDLGYFADSIHINRTGAIEYSRLIFNEFDGLINTCISDFDQDGDVDLSDFGIFGNAFGSMTGDSNYNLDADLDNDGDVDLGDFGVFGGQFGNGAAECAP